MASPGAKEAEMNANKIAYGLILMCGMAFVGAARSEPQEPAEPPVTVKEVEFTIGRVMHVNAPCGYVIIQCGSLPSADGEAKVCREGAVVARVKINGSERFPFVAADVVEGEPREGDTVKQVMKKIVRSPDDGRKE